MNRNDRLEVRFHDRTVGTLATVSSGADAHKIAFEYSDTWLRDGFSINPFSLPLREGVFLPKNWNFNGLFGVFADSLPDAWGQLLVDRLLAAQNVDPGSIGLLDRLSIVGTSGMGALTYHPEGKGPAVEAGTDLDYLAALCEQILRSKPVGDLDMLYRMGGSSGGTRPKVLASMDGEDWIIKFQSHVDPPEFGSLEYDYAECAVRCGIHMAEHRLFPSATGKGYFGMKRFDRKISDAGDTTRLHMLSAAAFLELDADVPSLDYHDLMKLTRLVTRENKEDLKDLFRRMCFNVFAHNRDDHAKNFSYLYDEEAHLWHLSPAYDLTYSNTYYGEHMTSVNGNGNSPSDGDLLSVGINAGLSESWCRETISGIRDTVCSDLEHYLA